MKRKKEKSRLMSLFLEHDVLGFNFKEPITFRSQIKSPVYCDCRKALGEPILRKLIVNELVHMIKVQRIPRLLDPRSMVIAGIPTGASPYGALVADALNLPFSYPRPDAKAKPYGLGNRVEGRRVKDMEVMLIEDLISTAESMINGAQVILEEGALKVILFSIFSYQMLSAKKNLAAAGLDEPMSVLTISDFLPVLKKKLPSQDFNSLKEWIEDPVAWSNKH